MKLKQILCKHDYEIISNKKYYLIDSKGNSTDKPFLIAKEYKCCKCKKKINKREFNTYLD